MKNFITMISFVVLSTACASTEHQVQDLPSDKLTILGGTSDGSKITLNEKKQAVIVSDLYVEQVLASAEMAHDSLQYYVERELFQLKQCKIDLADTRLGGSGEVEPVPQMRDFSGHVGIEEEMGLTADGELKIVRKEFLNQRLIALKQANKTLEKVLDETKESVEQCHHKLGKARLAHGLPSHPYQAKGYYTQDGVFVENRTAERNIDDAFEMAAESAGKKGKK